MTRKVRWKCPKGHIVRAMDHAKIKRLDVWCPECEDVVEATKLKIADANHGP